VTLDQVIRYTDEVKPNAYSPETKTLWLNQCEGLVSSEVMLLASEETAVYEYEKDRNRELLAGAPHDKIYGAYICAMIDFANGEYSKYQNSMEMFNSFFGEYMRWYASRYRPADGAPAFKGYYISAYGIAKKQGFQGTEAEWLESLKGERGISPTVETEETEGGWRISFKDAEGEKSISLRHGSGGGGGISPTVSFTETEDGCLLTVCDAEGEKSISLRHGRTPVKGTDYFTETDKTELVNDVLSALPAWTGGSY